MRSLAIAALVLALAAPAHAQRRGPAGGGASGGGAVSRSAPPPAPAPAQSAPRAQDQAAPPTRGQGAQATAQDGSRSNPPGRTQGDARKTGDAVKRTSPPDDGNGHSGHGGGGGVIIAPYPWFAAGAYFGGYYPYDPWPGWYPPAGPDSDPAPAVADDEGALKLKVKPVEASVYVDGDYAGIVDEFDGVFQKLPLASGPHRIELRAPDYEPLSFDVLIHPNQTTTYRGEMRKVEE